MVVARTGPETDMNAFLLATAVVTLAEIGDKTQLLALLLVARYREPWPIVLGIALSTLLNHALAATLGVWLSAAIGAEAQVWILGFGFLAMAIWVLIPDRLDAGAERRAARRGVFLATTVSFFFVEIGDKTQVATVALAATYAAPIAITLGTTLGMLLANAPVVFLGERLTQALPLRAVRHTAALAFFALGALTLTRAWSA